MTEIGKNASVINKIFDKDIVVGNEVGKYKTQREAENVASVNKGSELVYFGNDDSLWHVKEVKEKGIVFGTSNLSRADAKNISLDAEKMKKEGINQSFISFVEEEASDFTKIVIASSTTNTDILKNLSTYSPYEYVRVAVAQNLNTPIEVLKELSNDKSSSVRISVAANPNTPIEVLKDLYDDKNYDVRREVARNPKTPEYLGGL